MVVDPGSAVLGKFPPTHLWLPFDINAPFLEAIEVETEI